MISEKAAILISDYANSVIDDYDGRIKYLHHIGPSAIQDLVDYIFELEKDSYTLSKIKAMANELSDDSDRVDFADEVMEMLGIEPKIGFRNGARI